MKIKKILLIGFGNIGLKHSTFLTKLLPNVKVKVMHHKKNSNKLNKDFEIIDNIKQAIEYSPNLIVITNPTSLHLKFAMIFAEFKTNIFIEKPLSNNLRNINKLVNKAKKNDVFISVGYNLRYLPSLLFFKKLIDKKLIGKLYHFYSSVGYYLPDWRKNVDYRNTVSSNKKLGGGVLLELSHEIDYISWIFGNIDLVYSNISRQSKLKINVEDTCSLFFKIKTRNNSKKLIGSVIMDFLRRDKDRKCTLIGEKGTLIWNANNGTVDYFNAKKNKWQNLYNNKNEMNISYLNQWKDIIKRIESNKKPNINIFDGITALEVIESAKTSNNKGKEININHKYNQ